jgi:hypothetical protein
MGNAKVSTEYCDVKKECKTKYPKEDCSTEQGRSSTATQQEIFFTLAGWDKHHYGSLFPADVKK